MNDQFEQRALHLKIENDDGLVMSGLNCLRCYRSKGR